MINLPIICTDTGIGQNCETGVCVDPNTICCNDECVCTTGYVNVAGVCTLGMYQNIARERERETEMDRERRRKRERTRGERGRGREK